VHVVLSAACIPVLLAEDDILLRAGLASLLERSGFEVCGQAGDGLELMTLVRQHEPELVVVDISWPAKPMIDAFEILARDRVGLRQRAEAPYKGLVHPIHQQGRVFAWQIKS
jgi:DNA-binding NarL/FixJ family response regulator